MPKRAPKICADATCFTLVYDGGKHCAEHYKPWNGATRHRGVAHREARNDTAAHRRLCARVLGRVGYRCEIKHQGICIGTATQVDRIDNAKGYSDDNCQAACKPCHVWKTAREGHLAMGHQIKNPSP